MRIWHQNLIPRLCHQHLLGMWREGLGIYSIIINNKKGYRNHPAVQEFINCPELLYDRLQAVRNEMIKRNYKPKKLPKKITFGGKPKIWQTYIQQLIILERKNCGCDIPD